MDFKRALRRFVKQVCNIYTAISDKTPLTFFGLLLLLLNAFAFWYFALKHFDLAYFVISLLGGLLVLSLNLWVLLSYIVIRIRTRGLLDITAHQIETEVRVLTGYRLPAFRFWPLISLQVYWEYPPFTQVNYIGKGKYRDEEVLVRRRGGYKEIRRRFELTDILGLSSIRWVKTFKSSLEILPNRGRLSAFTVIPTLVKGEDVSHPSGEPIGDLVDMRRYVSGDSPRRILWKVYAHSRKLMVRIPERAIATSPRTSGFLFTSEKDEPSAGLARLAIEADILGKDWIFAVDGSFEYAEDRENAINLIVQSGNLEINNDLAYFQSFLKVSRSKGNYNLILFVPSSPGEWEEKLKLLKPDPFFDVAIAMAVDGSAQNLEGFTLKKYILKTEEIYRQSRKERVELLKRLNQFTRRITVIDRLTGRVLGNR